MKLTSLNQIEEEGETFEGKWQLDENHGLIYKERGRKKEARFKGTLVSVERGSLVFSSSIKEDEKRTVTRLFKLSGSWQVDPKNRIVFEVERGARKTDRLTLKGTWELGPRYEILYTYKQARLKTKTKVTQTLVFKGHWDLTERNRLAFQIEGDSDSTLRFKGAFESPSLLVPQGLSRSSERNIMEGIAKKGEIRYRIGFEIGGRRRYETLTFFGEWKISNDLELSFEMEYAKGEKRAFTFGATYHFNEDTSVTVELKAPNGKPLGLEVTFTREFFGKDGQLFLRLRKTAEESSAEAGVRLRF